MSSSIIDRLPSPTKGLYGLKQSCKPIAGRHWRQSRYTRVVHSNLRARSLSTAIQDATAVKTSDTPGYSYWQKIPVWSGVGEDEFMSHRWQVANTIDRKDKLVRFLHAVLPKNIPQPSDTRRACKISRTSDELIADLEAGIRVAPMAVRITPHILSVVDWSNPVQDPIRRQFVPLASILVPDHPTLKLDSLHESDTSSIEGLVHRYPDKVLFLATSVCPVYCRFCTRSYVVGGNTESVHSTYHRPTLRRWKAMFEYIERHPAIHEVVVSGGDSYYLEPEHLKLIGNRLLNMPNIKRIRFASKGLAVNPIRILDAGDGWAQAFIDLSNAGRSIGKQVSMHTHFNHPNEITWITGLAARHLFKAGVIVRN